MAPVEIQTSKPINPSTADDAPQPSTHTAGSNSTQIFPTQTSHPSTVRSHPPPPATDTYTPSSTTRDNTNSSPPSAAPEARPPGPTAAPSAAAVVQSPEYVPTRTVATDASANVGDPPAPQPGAAPVPPASTVTGSALPPPPKAGQAPYQPLVSTAQSGVASSPSFQAQPAASLSHPPGYQQNTSVVAEGASTPSMGSSAGLDPLGGNSTSGTGRSGLPFGGQTGGGGSMLGDSTKMQEQAGEAWTAVKGWAGVAGSKLAEVEKDVWNWVDKKS